MYLFTYSPSRSVLIGRRRRRRTTRRRRMFKSYLYTYYTYILHPPPSQPYKTLCFFKTVLTIFFFSFSLKGRESSPPSPPSPPPPLFFPLPIPLFLPFPTVHYNSLGACRKEEEKEKDISTNHVSHDRSIE